MIFYILLNNLYEYKSFINNFNKELIVISNYFQKFIHLLLNKEKELFF